MVEQLVLGVHWHDAACFENFYAGSNEATVLYLKDFLKRDVPDQGLFLWGPMKSGCSHLLQASCQVYAEEPVAYFPISAPGIQPAMLEGIETMALVCIDDIDQAAGDEAWEEALFHAYNRFQQAGTCFILGSHQSARQIDFRLKDLQSRIQGLLSLEIHPLSDLEKKPALQLRAANRGLTLPDEVADFLLRHYPRDMTNLVDALQRLDEASLVEKRRLTIPFVKEVLAF